MGEWFLTAPKFRILPTFIIWLIMVESQERKFNHEIREVTEDDIPGG